MIGGLILAALAATGGDADVERYVRVMIDVGADGRAAGCTITQTNAPPELAAKTCQVYRDKAYFTPKTDAAGHPVPGRVEATVKYRVPAPPPVAASDHTKALPTLPPLEPGGDTFTAGRWSGVCWKAKESDGRFERCEGRDLEPGSAVTIVRTREGLVIHTTAPACPGIEDMAKFRLPADKLAGDRVPTKTVGTLMTVTAMVGNSTCPAFPSPIPYDEAGLASFLAGTDPLIGR